MKSHTPSFLNPPFPFWPTARAPPRACPTLGGGHPRTSSIGDKRRRDMWGVPFRSARPPDEPGARAGCGSQSCLSALSFLREFRDVVFEDVGFENTRLLTLNN